MKYIIITMAMVSFFYLKGESKNIQKGIHLFVNTKDTKFYKFDKNINDKTTVLVCGVEEALAAIDYAFAIEAMGDSWCMNVQTTGTGLTDCFNFFSFQRQATVSFIMSNYEDCVLQTYIGTP